MDSSTVLGIPGFRFADLHDPARLALLHERFCEDVQTADPACWAGWDAYRRAPDASRTPELLSALLLTMAPYVGRFVARLFQIEPQAQAVRRATSGEDHLFRFKVDFVRRRAWPLTKAGTPVESTPDDDELAERLIAAALTTDRELAIARAGCALLDREQALERHTDRAAEAAQVWREIEALKRWCAARLRHPAYRHWVVFRLPEPMNYWGLVDVNRSDPLLPEALQGPDERLRRRDGFTLTDARMSPRAVLGEIHYCVLCHDRDKDSCSKGLLDKTGAAILNPLAVPLHGCPLDQKISETHALRKAGDPIAALAMVILDNPMCPGTGHRICNDCMTSCIYQKQTPVNIPQIETGVLTDVLAMPWGVEIYGLLTRWNPLNVRRPYALPRNGKHVLVVGLGPAGYTLAHYLVNEGFGVVGIDGLKIEP
ncbi:MAG: pyridine nucleotide-disulfide oxidoreductase, partial [Acidobacteriota bacterium]